MRVRRVSVSARQEIALNVAVIENVIQRFSQPGQTAIGSADIDRLRQLQTELRAVQGDEGFWAKTASEPTFLNGSGMFSTQNTIQLFGPEIWIKGRLACFKDWIFDVPLVCTHEEMQHLVRAAHKKIERQTRPEADDNSLTDSANSRERIPVEVRDAVWRRDQGKCVRCGCRERLEYDHIIPVSEGGSNTARNLELLCERCNRQKGAGIGR
jgi:hypothetical protein